MTIILCCLHVLIVIFELQNGSIRFVSALPTLTYSPRYEQWLMSARTLSTHNTQRQRPRGGLCICKRKVQVAISAFPAF
jgi:hypothetical protein